jgi:hypothetical protein
MLHLGVLTCLLACAGALASPKPISRLEKAADALEIQNIMGRYAIYVVANKWNEIGELFALDQPDVRQNVPFAMSGAAMEEYFAKRAQEKTPPGVFHQHSFLAPLIEVAGDGKTAKGVWDSLGIDAANGDAMPNWGWVRYAIDFMRVNGEWKIWHMQVLQMWRAPYGEAWAGMVQRDSHGTKSGGGAPSWSPAPAAAAATAAAPPAANAAAPMWRYNGTDDTPLVPANLPKPYYSFDPKDAY